MTLTSECKKGHNVLTWGCTHCDEKLVDRIKWIIYLESIKK